MSENFKTLRLFGEMTIPENLEPEIKEKFELIENLKSDHNFVRALEESEELTNLLKNKLKDSENIPLYFDNEVSELLYKTRHPEFKPEESEMPLFQALYSLGSLLVEEQYPKRAAKVLAEALEIAPYSSVAAIELVQALISAKNYDEAEKVINYALSFTYEPQYIARLFRSLGFIYIEKGELDLASFYYITSLHFEDSPVAQEELAYIQQLNNGVPAVNVDKFDQYMQNNKFDVHSDLSIFMEITDYLQENSLTAEDLSFEIKKFLFDNIEKLEQIKEAMKSK